MNQPGPADLILLYDGVCGFCNQSVQSILKYDKRGTMRFAALQSDFGRAVINRHPFLSNVDSIILLEKFPHTGEEKVLIRSTAALGVISYLGGLWRILLLFYIIPRPIRDFFYDLFAKYRYRFFGKYDSCMLPPPDVRSRFIDAALSADRKQ